ncbi:uncharacterized protein LOC134788560 [Penaeus indicus]|uniref:uncharacterized protein LOC134788560 n=1 Tax=Penaeus indicus TaxID=29960 RepID=UPI00300D41FC
MAVCGNDSSKVVSGSTSSFTHSPPDPADGDQGQSVACLSLLCVCVLLREEEQPGCFKNSEGNMALRAALCLVFLGFFAVAVRAHFGSCEDHTPLCVQWARNGGCRQDQLFMIQNCPVSCNLCLDPECRDRNHNCAAWAREGNCVTHPLQMIPTCPHSCDACIIPY